MTNGQPLKDQLLSLVQLQEIDLKVDRLLQQRQQLPVELKSIEDALTKKRKFLDEKTAALKEIEKTHRQSSAAIEMNQERLSRTSKRIEDVKNTKEFQAASKEIEQLKKFNDELESQRLKHQQDLDAAQKIMDGFQAEIDELEKTKASKMSDLKSREGVLDTDLRALNAERDAYLKKIDLPVWNRYERVRKVRAGVGIVPAVMGRCKGCNIGLPPQKFNELHKYKEAIECPSCHRILFIPPTPTENTVAGSGEVPKS